MLHFHVHHLRLSTPIYSDKTSRCQGGRPRCQESHLQPRRARVMGWYETGQEKAQTRSSCRRQPRPAVSAVRRCDTTVAAERPCPQRGHAHSVSELLNPNLLQGLQFVSCCVSCETIGAHCSRTAFGLAARKPQPAAEPGSGEHLPAALWLSDRKWLRHTIESERETERESKWKHSTHSTHFRGTTVETPV